MSREKITFNSSTIEVMTIMSENNFGAADILLKMLENDCMFSIFNLDDMNIRGEQIWYGYKNVCGEDFDIFIQTVNERSEDFVKKINVSCPIIPL